MTSFRELAVACFALAGVVSMRAELQQWVQHLESGSAIESILFRTVPMPAGPVKSRKPPKETVAALAAPINAAPRQAALYRIRAGEAEQALDFTRAEADWQRYLQLAADKFEAGTALADFYHRRLEPQKELAALLTAAALPSKDATRAAIDQASWKTFVRALALAQAQALPSQPVHQAWMARYATEPSVYVDTFNASLERRDFANAEGVLAAYRRQFASDAAWPVMARANLERVQGNAERSLAVYEQSFQPLMPPALVADWFRRLRETRNLRKFLGDQRAAATARPADLAPAVKLFYYWQQQNNLEQAHRALFEFEQRKPAMTAEETFALARLFEETHNYVESARLFGKLQSMNGATALDAERGLAGLIRVLLTAPEMPIRIGAGDLSYWKDVATLDPYPGTLNGMLSLLFNTTYPSSRFSQQEQASTSYFHRAKAAELMVTFDQRFASSPERAALHAKLIEAYGIHGDNDGVIRRGRQYLAGFPQAPQRTEVALAMADAHARKKQNAEELAVYATLLNELAAEAGKVPLGDATANVRDEEGPRSANVARSPAYVKVLDQYIGRLVASKRIRDVLAVYRAQIVNNPNDSGLYARLAVFLDQNKLAVELEQTYQQAMQRFQEPSWSHKLARWYLRTKRMQQFTKLTREVTGIFSGTDLDEYFQQIVGQGAVDANLYRQLNLFAHQRFPHDLVFVRNLLNAYRRRETADRAAWEALIRQHWYYDEQLRNRFFEHLSASGKLDAEIRAIEAMTPKSDRAAVQFVAEARAWRGYFEEAAAPFRSLSAGYPAEQSLGLRASALHRSLGEETAAVEIARRLSSAAPRDTMQLARVGEIFSDREKFGEARPQWNRIAAVEPGNASGYLESATVFWDYFLYDDALRVLRDGRTKLKDPALYAFEAGAIFENKRQYPQAVAEYVRGAMAGQGNAQSRLLRLARQPAQRDLVESATRQLVSGADPDLAAFGLRVAILENQARAAELRLLLGGLAPKTNSWELLARIDEVSSRQGFDDIRQTSIVRQAEISADPVEKMRLRLQLARFLENKGEQSKARQTIEALYRENPRILGVVRAAADYYWRNKNSKEAVDVLESAASNANAEYKRKLILEASNKASLSGDYVRSRRLLQPFLEAEPLSPELIAAMADSYARQGDNPGLRQFYSGKIAAAGRTEQAAAMRRSLVPVLSRIGDHAAATEQYIQLLNRYPGDTALLSEASTYARRNGTVPQLVGFYRKAAADSPRDARWPAVLARIYVATETPDQALNAYTQSVAISPERKDLWIERAGVEERLHKFNEAAATYTRIYDLSYRAPLWMVHVAENRARLGQSDAAVQALRTAFLENRAVRAQDLFEVATKLESWNLLPQAREFAGQGLGKVKPKDPLAVSDLRVYMRIATRLRDQEAGYTAVSGIADPSSKPAILAELGATAHLYFTPEEKVSLGAYLRKLQPSEPTVDMAAVAAAAGLADVEAALLAEQLRRLPTQQTRYSVLPKLIGLQKRRMRFDELANQIEAYWRIVPESEDKDQLLQLVSDAFRSAGSYNNELRVLSVMEAHGKLAGALTLRYNYLLRTQAPARLLIAAEKGTSNEIRDNAVATALEGDDPVLALQSVASRGVGLPPVWTKAYTALTGLHFARATDEIAAAFQGALGTQVIGEQLGRQVDRTQQLAGDNWFYYGGRYGEYLKVTQKAAEADDYIAAEIEGRPANASAYANLASYYAEQKEFDRALSEFEHALQFDARRPGVHLGMAEIYWSQGKQAEARDRVRLALRTLAEQQDSGRAPESYWRDASAAIQAIGRYRALAELRNEANSLLKTYIRRNGAYRAEPLVRAVLGISDLRWIGDLARSASDPVGFLESFVNDFWVTEEQRVEVYARMLELARERMDASRGDAFEQAASNRQRVLLDYAGALLEANHTSRASALLESISLQDRRQYAPQIAALEVRLAAATNSLPALLARYAASSDPPALDALRNTAMMLRNANQAASWRVLEYVYQQELQQQYPPSAATLLGLAEVKLQQGDTAAATALLRRMPLISPEGFGSLDSAAALFERFQKTPEAIEFRQRLAQAAPWNRSNLVALAALRMERTMLAELAKSSDTPYADRADASVASQSVDGLGSGELNYLARGGADADAEKPYYHAARLKAAEKASDHAVRFRLLRGALEVKPADDSARMLLFRSALAVNRNQGAVSAWEPLLAHGSWGQALIQFKAAESDPDLRYMTGDLLAAQPERAIIARELAGAYRKLHYLPAAEVLLRASQQLAPSPATAAELASVQAEQRVREANTQRAPVIRRTLEQERSVRPKLAASAGVAP